MNWENWHQHEDPCVSVVVPSYPASDHRPLCNHLEATQTFDAYEIVAVNDGALDICEARTEGIREAKADIIAITDDDCEPPDDWVESVWREFNADTELGLLEGRVEGGINYEGTHQYVGCNLAMRKAAALEIDGFDSRFAGWRDDTEFGWRMERETTWKTKYSDSVRMVHPPYPRSNIDVSLERLLRTEYPDRYEAHLNDSIGERLWRIGMRAGVVPFINRIRRPSK